MPARLQQQQQHSHCIRVPSLAPSADTPSRITLPLPHHRLLQQQHQHASTPAAATTAPAVLAPTRLTLFSSQTEPPSASAASHRARHWQLPHGVSIGSSSSRGCPALRASASLLPRFSRFRRSRHPTPCSPPRACPQALLQVPLARTRAHPRSPHYRAGGPAAITIGSRNIAVATPRHRPRHRQHLRRHQRHRQHHHRHQPAIGSITITSAISLGFDTPPGLSFASPSAALASPSPSPSAASPSPSPFSSPSASHRHRIAIALGFASPSLSAFGAGNRPSALGTRHGARHSAFRHGTRHSAFGTALSARHSALSRASPSPSPSISAPQLSPRSSLSPWQLQSLRLRSPTSQSLSPLQQPAHLHGHRRRIVGDLEA